MVVIDEDDEPDWIVPEEDARHLVGELLDPRGPDSLGRDEIRHVGDGPIPEPESSSLGLRHLLALASGLVWPGRPPKLVGRQVDGVEYAERLLKVDADGT